MRDLISDEVIDAEDLLATLADGPRSRFAADHTVDFLSELATRLLRPGLTRAFPEIASLGFFLRRAELNRVIATSTTSDPDILRTPRGLVFHIPPANVDTIFVYSWALSVLCGNTNVVRVSARTGGSAARILEILRDLLGESTLNNSQRFISMEHTDPGLPLLSRACDVRIVWGGDRAVAQIRQYPLSLRATELTFPDRSSLALIGAQAVLASTEEELESLAHSLVNDVWWFDQAACSSPRAIVWVGQTLVAERAHHRLFDAVERHLARQGLGQDQAMSVERRVSLYGAAMDQPGSSLSFDHRGVGVLRTPNMLVRGWFGAGGFTEMVIESVDALPQHLIGKDQTVTHFGVSRAVLFNLVEMLGGKAVDRLVPIGQALAFSRVWDGYDLIGAMTKFVTVSGGVI